MKPLEVFITFPDTDSARRAARILVEKHLAACVNIVPRVHSVYRWKGQIEEDQEALAIIKTYPSQFEELCREVKAHHPYELPAITGIPVEVLPQNVAEWLDESMK